MVGIHDVSLVLSDFEVVERNASSRILHHVSSGDGVGVYFFDLTPDIGAPLRDLDAVRASYRGLVTEAGGGLVEVDITEVARATAVRTLFKFPQQPSGMSYLGSFTLPFRSFSIVIKVQCLEHGMTGMRDSIVFASQQPPIDPETGVAVGWMQDPYAPSHRAPVLRNMSDDAQWDSQFPEHPLSRCRRHLEAIGEALSVSQAVLDAPPFLGPAR